MITVTNIADPDLYPEMGWEGSQLPLPADATIYVPPMCFAAIPHGVHIKTADESLTWMLKEPMDDEQALGLVVTSGIVEDGEVRTIVFNLTAKQIKVTRGQAITRLVCVRVVTSASDHAARL